MKTLPLFPTLLLGLCLFSSTSCQESSSNAANPQSHSTIDSLNQANLAAGETFLAQKSKEAGVSSLGGGILYKELRAGTGNSPTQQSTVLVDYEGRLIDGSIFDSSYQRGQAASFPVGGVITGWQVVLKAMKPGSIWEVYLPHHMAYGEQGSGSNIPPYSTLIFKIELKEVQ